MAPGGFITLGLLLGLINKLTAGEIDIDTFLDGLATVQGNDTDAKIEAGGYDLDPTTADTAK